MKSEKGQETGPSSEQNVTSTDDKQSIHSHDSQASAHKQQSIDENNSTAQKKKLGKYGFRLSPEEQEIAYELKASLMKDLHNQNAKIKSEVELHSKLQQIKRQERAKSAHPAYQTEMSRMNAIKLMKLYEKNSINAEKRVKELEKDLEISQDLARRYHSMYMREINEKNSSGNGASSNRSVEKNTQSHKNQEDSSVKSNHSESSREKQKDKVTEDDLEDEEALYKRHIARLADMKSVKVTSPIRVTDVIRKSEQVHMQNEDLRREVQRLKYDNAQLIKQAKHSKEERDRVLHNLGTSELARQDILKRLEREKTQHQKLQRSLTRQASEWIQHQKQACEEEERRRWINVGAIGPYDSESRASYTVKKNVDRPRKMQPVNTWDKMEEKT